MSEFIGGGKKIGILGGGQLGKMLIQAASKMDLHCCVLDPNPECSCAPYAHEFTEGGFNDYDAVLNFGRTVDLITIEIENVNTEALRVLRDEGKMVYPSPEVIETIKDKGVQKQFYKENGIPTSDFTHFAGAAEIRAAIDSGNLALPFVQKLCREGYDGRGVSVIKSTADLEKLLDGESIAEELVAIDKEVSVVMSRNSSGEVNAFPPVEMEFSEEANLVEMLLAPARISDEYVKEAIDLGRKVVEKIDLVGVMAVEMFLTSDGRLLVNESAPRPHNSGHHTIEANDSSQYEQHLRSIIGLPLGSVAQISPAIMINVLGAKGHTGDVIYRNVEKVLNTPGAHLHLYGKRQTKPFRKMGHITICGRDMETIRGLGNEIKNTLSVEAESSDN